MHPETRLASHPCFSFDFSVVFRAGRESGFAKALGGEARRRHQNSARASPSSLFQPQSLTSLSTSSPPRTHLAPFGPLLLLQRPKFARGTRCGEGHLGRARARPSLSQIRDPPVTNDAAPLNCSLPVARETDGGDQGKGSRGRARVRRGALRQSFASRRLVTRLPPSPARRAPAAGPGQGRAWMGESTGGFCQERRRSALAAGTAPAGTAPALTTPPSSPPQKPKTQFLIDVEQVDGLAREVDTWRRGDLTAPMIIEVRKMRGRRRRPALPRPPASSRD